MADEQKAKPRLEIAHVLFMDIVGYSKLLTDEQSEALHELNQIVRNTEAAREAEAAGKLTILPTGDGMALVFTGSVEEPVECALEISHALRAQPTLPVRMGIHSGPVHHVKDANERENIAGVGINIAQRVMDCGDAGHILVSKRVADDLAQQRRWQPYLHELGDVEVKHGVVVSLVNLYAETIGNPTPPTRIGKVRCSIPRSRIGTRKALSPLARAIFAVAVLLLVLAIVSVIFAPAIMRTLDQRQVTSPPQVPAIPSPPSIADAIKSEVAKKITDELQGAFSAKKNAAVEPSTTGSAVPEKSIAVLPFENLSRDPDNAYFTEGVQEEILTRLAKIADLKVISRTSTQRFKSSPDNLPQIGQQLGVANVLEGSVQKAADKVRVNVQLINATTDTHLWAEIYDRKLTDIFAVESDIAKTIAETLRVKLSDSEERMMSKKPTANPEAHELYLKGRYFWNKRSGADLKKAIDYFNQAIGKDPNYALAYAGLADAYLLLEQYAGFPASESLPKAKAAIDRALEIDDSLAEAHTSLATIYQALWRWEEAEEEFRHAISLNSNYPTAHHWFAYYFYVKRRLDDAMREIKRAQELDPLSPVISENVALVYLLKNALNSAVEQCQKVIELDPSFADVHYILGFAYLKQGRNDEATAEFQKAVGLSGRASTYLSDLGCCYAVIGRRAEALALLEELKEKYAERESTGQFLAGVYAGLGDKDQAFAWLEKDFQQRSGQLPTITWRLNFEELRSDPRYADLVRRMALEP